MLKSLLTFRYMLVLAIILIWGGIVVNNLWNQPSDPVYSWRGIVPGQTTKQEVLRLLGEPDNIIECEAWGTRSKPLEPVRGHSINPCLFAPLVYEYFEKPRENAPHLIHQVHFRNGQVWLVIENVTAARNYIQMSNEEVIAAYGWPEIQARSILRDIDHFVYCETGLIIAHNDEEALIVFYFEPTRPTVCFVFGDFGLYLTVDPSRPIRN